MCYEEEVCGKPKKGTFCVDCNKKTSTQKTSSGYLCQACIDNRLDDEAELEMEDN